MAMSKISDRQVNIDPDEIEYIITQLRLLQQQTENCLVSEQAAHLINNKFDSMVTVAVDLELILDQYTEYPTRAG